MLLRNVEVDHAFNNRTPRVAVAIILLLAAPNAFSAATPVADYPNKSIRLIVPNGIGGSTDLVSRTLAQKLSEGLSQPVIVDNRGGSGGIIGTEMVARAIPDGYTLLVGTIGNLAISPHLYKKLAYDAIRDFAPVAQVSAAAYMVLVHPSLPAKLMKELAALAQATPGQLRYASAGSGTGSHLATELFLSAANIKITHVPYKSGAAMTTSILSDESQVAFNGITSSLPPMKNGRVRVLAVTTPNRVAVAPEIPTIAEAGFPGAVSTSWTGLLAPAGTPKAVVTRLNAEVRKALQSADVKNVLTSAGAEPVGNSPEQFSAYLKTELVKWGKVVRATGATAE